MDEGLIQAPINIPAVPRRAREDGSSGLGRDPNSPESYAWIEPRGRKSEDTVSQEGTLQKPLQERVVRRWSIPAHLKSPHKHPVLNGMRETESQEQVTQPVPLASIASIRGRLTGRVMAATPPAARPTRRLPPLQRVRLETLRSRVARPARHRAGRTPDRPDGNSRHRVDARSRGFAPYQRGSREHSILFSSVRRGSRPRLGYAPAACLGQTPNATTLLRNGACAAVSQTRVPLGQ